MKNNVLLLIDLSKNYDKLESNKSYVYLNRGSINLENCTQIRLSQLEAIKKSSYDTFLNFLKRTLSKKKKTNFFITSLR